MAAGDETFANWNSAIAQVIGALETDDLPRLLVDALKTRVPFEFALVILYRLTDVAPEGFRESEYYKSYYIKTFQSDEACFFSGLPRR